MGSRCKTHDLMSARGAPAAKCRSLAAVGRETTQSSQATHIYKTGRRFVFVGFSLRSHRPTKTLPFCSVYLEGRPRVCP